MLRASEASKCALHPDTQEEYEQERTGTKARRDTVRTMQDGTLYVHLSGLAIAGGTPNINTTHTAEQPKAEHANTTHSRTACQS